MQITGSYRECPSGLIRGTMLTPQSRKVRLGIAASAISAAYRHSATEMRCFREVGCPLGCIHTDTNAVARGQKTGHR
jgi:hypothetical protein